MFRIATKRIWPWMPTFGSHEWFRNIMTVSVSRFVSGPRTKPSAIGYPQ
jgi:hypothetical protein